MVGNPRHGNRLAGTLAALGQGDVQQTGGLLGIAEEQLVEIPHAVEHQLIRVFGLDRQVLLHHRRMLAQVRAHASSGGYQ